MLVRLSTAADGLKSETPKKPPETKRLLLSVSIFHPSSVPPLPALKAHIYCPVLVYLATKTSALPLLDILATPAMDQNLY